MISSKTFDWILGLLFCCGLPALLFIPPANANTLKANPQFHTDESVRSFCITQSNKERVKGSYSLESLVGCWEKAGSNHHIITIYDKGKEVSELTVTYNRLGEKTTFKVYGKSIIIHNGVELQPLSQGSVTLKGIHNFDVKRLATPNDLANYNQKLRLVYR